MTSRVSLVRLEHGGKKDRTHPLAIVAEGEFLVRTVAMGYQEGGLVRGALGYA